MRRLIGVGVCALVAVGLTAAFAASKPAAAPKGKLVKVSNSRFGPILVDGRRRTLYLFTRDAGRRRSRCRGACARAWPPLLTPGRPRAEAGVERSGLGTTRRRGGRRQVTYKGSPLYYYIGETRAGQILCQDVAEFGGTWYLVRPKGSPVG